MKLVSKPHSTVPRSESGIAGVGPSLPPQEHRISGGSLRSTSATHSSETVSQEGVENRRDKTCLLGASESQCEIPSSTWNRIPDRIQGLFDTDFLGAGQFEEVGQVVVLQSSVYDIGRLVQVFRCADNFSP